jgi:hypothetical protein
MLIINLIIKYISNSIKYLKDKILNLLVYISNYTIYFTCEKDKIELQASNDIGKIIYIIWGIVGTVLLCFFIFVSINFYFILGFFSITISIWVKLAVIFIPTVMIYNIYYLGFKTIHPPIENAAIFLRTILKIVIISLILFFFTFPYLYKSNLQAINDKCQIFRKTDIIKNEYLINVKTASVLKESLLYNYIKTNKNNEPIIILTIALTNKKCTSASIASLKTYNKEYEKDVSHILQLLEVNYKNTGLVLSSDLSIIKDELKSNLYSRKLIISRILKNNMLMYKITEVYNWHNFKRTFIYLCIFFNSPFFLKILQFILDAKYVALNKEEDDKVINNIEFH